MPMLRPEQTLMLAPEVSVNLLLLTKFLRPMPLSFISLQMIVKFAHQPVRLRYIAEQHHIRGSEFGSQLAETCCICKLLISLLSILICT